MLTGDKGKMVDAGALPLVLNYGMGVDSTAILLELIRQSKAGEFDLSRLTVLTAMVGDEFPDTENYVVKYILPLMRKHNIRYVQVARKGPYKADGYEVLEDSHQPQMLHFDGIYKISDENFESSSIPQYGGTRKCSLKAKGVPLDAWLTKEFHGEYFIQIIGYGYDEARRVKKAEKIDARKGTMAKKAKEGLKPIMWYPLYYDWKWDREYSIQFIKEQLGITFRWPKSCCVFCPFVKNESGFEDHLARWKSYPDAAAHTMKQEYRALLFNETQTVYKGYSAVEAIHDSQNWEANIKFMEWLKGINEWSVYRMRRVWKLGSNGKPTAARSITKMSAAYKKECLKSIFAEMAAGQGKCVTCDKKHYEYDRLIIAPKMKYPVYPYREEMWVVAPSEILEKVRPKFDENWWDIAEYRIDEEPQSMLDIFN